MNQNKILSIIIIIAAVVSGGSFYAGVKYGQSKNSAIIRGTGESFNFSGNGTGAGSRVVGQRTTRGAGNSNGGIAVGEIISKDDILIRRPATGIEPKRLKDVIGKTAAKNIKADMPIRAADVKW